MITDRFSKTLSTEKSLVGMLHLRALPGTPKNEQTLEEIEETALHEAKLFEDNGYTGVILENMHDRPYVNGGHSPETVACMTRVARRIKSECRLKLGIQVLSGGHKEALACALASGADFVRIEAFAFSHIGDEGWMDSCAGELLRYRKQIGAENIFIFADIKKKHASHAVTADVDIFETSEIAEFFLADGLIVTGSSTGKKVELQELKKVYERSKLPVAVGSGVTPRDVDALKEVSDMLIVGSSLKKNGFWENELDASRVSELANRFFSEKR